MTGRDDTQRFHDDVDRRARGRCEARISPKCWRGYISVSAHHVVTRARGVGWPWLNDADRNGLGCCPECHEWIHRHPAAAAEAGMLAARPADDSDPGPVLERIAAARV